VAIAGCGRTRAAVAGAGRTATAVAPTVATSGAARLALAAATAARTAAAVTMARCAAAQLDRLGACARVRLEARDHLTRQRLLDQFLDVFQHVVLVHADQRHGFAGGAGTAG